MLTNFINYFSTERFIFSFHLTQVIIRKIFPLNPYIYYVVI